MQTHIELLTGSTSDSVRSYSVSVIKQPLSRSYLMGHFVTISSLRVRSEPFLEPQGLTSYSKECHITVYTPDEYNQNLTELICSITPMERGEKEAQEYVWEAAIPLQIHLHDSEVTTLPSPSPALILAPRIGYLPLLASQIKPFFSEALPPGVDTIWFEYKGLPLKWYIPTGVLFDLLCAEPERPWNLTVHFRGYPGNILIPCDGEDSVKWSYINSLKEAAYIIHGSSKNVMNMSHPDQFELWRSVMNGKLETYNRISSKLKLGIIGDEFSRKVNPSPLKGQHNVNETEATATVKASRIPVRLYLWTVNEDFDELEEAPHFDSWDQISYINRPVEFNTEGKYFSLLDAVKSILPEFYPDPLNTINAESKNEQTIEPEKESHPVIKLLRIQGIEPKMEIPFSWVVNNLMNPDYFLHICLYIKAPKPIDT